MNPSYINGLLGGMLIGLAAVILFWFNGRIMGVSSIVSSLLKRPGEGFCWRVAFVAGLVLGGWVYGRRFPIQVTIEASDALLVLAGLLVGIGTVIGSGCTSGHGICGIARFSKRSIIATIIFMSMGIFTVWLKRIIGI